MKLVKCFLLLLLLTVCGENLFAYKVYKDRDHWGIFGGFSAVDQTTNGYIDGSGTFIITSVFLTCKGWGGDACSEAVAAMPAQNNDVFGVAGTANINAIFANAETQQANGTTSGTLAQTYAIQQANGSFKLYHYIVSWAAATPNHMELDITEITP